MDEITFTIDRAFINTNFSAFHKLDKEDAIERINRQFGKDIEKYMKKCTEKVLVAMVLEKHCAND